MKKTPSKKSTDSTATVDPRHSSLMEFFVDELKDVYYAEKHLYKALAKLSKGATTNELKQAFTDHRAETEVHIQRIEEVFEHIGKKPQAKKCEAMVGIVEEASSILEDTKADTITRDAALIIGAQKAEHYEIASYGGLIALAKTMGHTEIADILYQTLEEEKATDEKLTGIAEGSINEQANQEPADEEDEEETDDVDDEEEEDEEDMPAPPKKAAKKGAPKKAAPKKAAKKAR